MRKTSARGVLRQTPADAIAQTISVIVPVYNGALHLERCVGSITASRYPNYSCIVVNDSSTDESGIIATRLGVGVLNLAGGPFGPACARNRGANVAEGTILFFVDSDVAIAPGSLEQVAEIFRKHPDVDAIFGSYDADPAAPQFVSQYRNLLHHYVHQNGRTEASTFWAGCGAIRASVFRQLGGFDEKTFRHPSIEDIELGFRLRNSGHRVLLVPSLQGKHLKRWTFFSLIKNDITRRALPWSRLVIETRHIPNDLNLSWRQRWSALLAVVACISVAVSWFWPLLFSISIGCETAVLILNRDLYRFFARQRGVRFAAGCVPLHFAYYLTSAATYLFVSVTTKLRRARWVRKFGPENS